MQYELTDKAVISNEIIPPVRELDLIGDCDPLLWFLLRFLMPRAVSLVLFNSANPEFFCSAYLIKHNKSNEFNIQQWPTKKLFLPNRDQAVWSLNKQAFLMISLLTAGGINTAAESPDAPHLHRSNGDNINEDKEWEVVGSDDGSSEPKNETNMHFDMTLGWGRWKHTLYSVDYNKTSQPVDDDSDDDDQEDDEDDEADEDENNGDEDDEDVDEKDEEEGDDGDSDSDGSQRKPDQHKGKTG